MPALHVLSLWGLRNHQLATPQVDLCTRTSAAVVLQDSLGQSIDDVPAIAVTFDDPRVPQNPEMMRHVDHFQIESRSNFTDTLRPRAKHVDDPQTDRLG